MQADLGGSVGDAGVAASYTYAARYLYSDVVVVNDNFLRLSPCEDAYQTPLSSAVKTDPVARLIQYKDQLGNPTHRLRLTSPHTKLIILAVGSVRIKSAPETPEDVALDALQYDEFVEEYLLPSPMVHPDRLMDAARAAAGGADSLLNAVESVVGWVHSNIRYIPGSTSVATTAEQSLEMGWGVCQDMAHISLGMLRALGIPSRYCSGLLSTAVGETHAWLEFLHPQLGWLPSDPTRGMYIASDAALVKFAVGRDYNQASPVEGSFVSTGHGGLDVAVAQVVQSPEPMSFEDALSLLESANGGC